MNTHRIEASQVINASPENVYEVISDYRVGHPAILPEPYFTALEVKKGGKGAGTELVVTLEVYGQKYTYHQIVTEPEPGRILAETEVNTGERTQFIIDPVDDGRKSKVTIASDLAVSGGIKGIIQRLVQPVITRRIYHQELQNLENYLQAT